MRNKKFVEKLTYTWNTALYRNIIMFYILAFLFRTHFYFKVRFLVPVLVVLEPVFLGVATYSVLRYHSMLLFRLRIGINRK